MITNEIRQEKVKNLPGAVFELYTSAEITSLIKQSVTKYQITNKDSFIDTIGDTIIGLLPRNTLEQNLVSAVSFTTETARLIVTDLKAFLDKIPNENASIPTANIESKERLELHPDGERGNVANNGEVVGTDGKVLQKDGAAKPLTRDELMSALAGKRTMAGDIEAVRKAREAAKNE